MRIRHTPVTGRKIRASDHNADLELTGTANKLIGIDAGGDGAEISLGDGLELTDSTLSTPFTFDGDSLIFTAPDGTRYVIGTSVEAAVAFSRVIFGWNQDANLDSARFPSLCEITPTTGLIAYSPRKINGVHGAGDGEQGMRLDVVPYTLDPDAQTLTLGTPVVVDTPADFDSVLGAIWQVQLLRLSSGRILLFAQELNSPDGTYAHADSRYDLILYYSDDDGATWSAKQVLLLGDDAHVEFGLPDYNSAVAGFHVPGGVNVVNQLSSGRIVITGYLHAPAPGYLASIYTDDATTGLTGWTLGAVLEYPSSNFNEPSTCLASDGTLIATVRNEATNARGIFTSESGETWTYLRNATDAPIRNVASPAYGNGTAIYSGGATSSSGGDNRQAFKIFKSTSDGAGFSVATDELFNPVQRIGYSFLTRLSSGWYLMPYEVTSKQSPDSFNQMTGLSLAVFNPALLNGAAFATGTHDSDVYTASEEYDLYEAYVTGDGGTIQDAAACEAAIAAAIAGNYYSGIGLAVSARWGHKDLGAGVNAKLYSLNRTATSSAGMATGLVLDTSTYAYPTLKFPDSGAWVTSTFALRESSTSGVIIVDKATDTESVGGLGFTWTDSVIHNLSAHGTMSINGDVVVQGSPIYQTTDNEVGHYIIDWDARTVTHGKDGTDLQSVTYFPVYNTANETATVKLYPLGGGNRFLAEAWFFNGATPDAIRQAGADLAARY